MVAAPHMCTMLLGQSLSEYIGVVIVEYVMYGRVVGSGSIGRARHGGQSSEELCKAWQRQLVRLVRTVMQWLLRYVVLGRRYGVGDRYGGAGRG